VRYAPCCARFGSRPHRQAFGGEFVAVTDVALQAGKDRHQFVADTLCDAGIEPVPLARFAVWVAKLQTTTAVISFQ